MLIAVVFLAVATLGSRLQQHYKFFIAYLAIVALSLTLYWLIVCFRAIFYRQEFLITEVGSTKLDIQTSAFQDLEMETNS